MLNLRVSCKKNIISLKTLIRAFSRSPIIFLLSISFLLIFFLAGPALASTVQFSLIHNATSNIFQSYQPLSDQLTSASLDFSGDSGSISLYGNFGLSYLYKYSGLSSFSGKMGADYLAPVGTKSAFYFALEGEAFLFRSLYADFNHGTARLLANFKSYLTAATILRIDTITQLKNYKYSIFDYFSENLSISLDRYFSSRTTFKIEAGYGYKLYFHPGVITITEETGTLVEASSNFGSLNNLGLSGLSSLSSTQALALQGGPGDHGNPGKNYEMGGSYSIRGIPYQTVYYTGKKSLQIFTLSGLIAQGLGDHLGLSLGALKQWYLRGENPFASSDELFMVENPTYDQFSWEGYSLRAKLTTEISGNLHGEFEYDYFSRNFPGITSLDLDGNSLGITREDKRHQFNARIQLELRRVTFFVNYAYINNTSNDPWFTWKGNVISGGLIWNLQVSPSQ